MKFLDARYNVEWEAKDRKIGRAQEADGGSGGEPCILHYSSPVKPWTHPYCENTELFWHYARKTCFYEEILYKNIWEENNCFARWIFPWSEITPGSNVILYGGGKVGKTYIEQIRRTEYCHILAVCDKEPDKVRISLAVISLEDIADFDYDFVLIAIEKEEVAGAIRADLIHAGVEAEKIRWKQPLRKELL